MFEKILLAALVLLAVLLLAIFLALLAASLTRARRRAHHWYTVANDLRRDNVRLHQELAHYTWNASMKDLER